LLNSSKTLLEINSFLLLNSSKILFSVKACLRYIHMRRRLDHVSHLESTVTGILLVDNARIQLLSFLYKILHVRHPSYLFSLFHIASSARTRNLTVPAHRTLAMSQSFVVLGCRAWNSLPHDVKRLLTHGMFVSALRGMYRSPSFVCVSVGTCALLCCAISGPGWLVTRTVTWLRFCRIGMVLCEVAEDLTQNISNDIPSFFCF
jgi:hypothetical protein